MKCIVMNFTVQTFDNAKFLMNYIGLGKFDKQNFDKLDQSYIQTTAGGEFWIVKF